MWQSHAEVAFGRFCNLQFACLCWFFLLFDLVSFTRFLSRQTRRDVFRLVVVVSWERLPMTGH